MTADDRLVIVTRATVNRAELAERVVVTNFAKRRLTLVFQILRLLTNRAISEKAIPLPYRCRIGNGDVVL